MTTVKVPKQIQVGGHTYSIVLDDNMRDNGDFGVVNHRTQQIHINPVRPESQKIETLIHELLHVINNVYLNRRLDEDAVNGISEGLCQVGQQFGVRLVWQDLPRKDVKT